MYQVSEEYIEQMLKRGTRRRLSGTIGSVPFSGDDIVKDSFSVTAKATTESDTKIGGVFLGELEMTFVPSFLTKLPRGCYEGKQVSVSIGLFVENEWVDVPIGVYSLDAPKISKQGISVSGYDNMQKLDKPLRIDSTSASPFGFLNYLTSECGVELGQSQAEIEALPNGTEVLGVYEENDIETFRDLLYWVAQSCGCFACADRQGRIVLRKLGVPTSIVIDDEHRDNDVIFSDYVTKWTGVSFVDISTKTTRYYGLEVDDGLTMNLGANPLLQLGTSDAVERRRRNVLNAIAQIQYTPFYVNSARDPIFDLGDEIRFTGGMSGNSVGCVMSYTYALTNYSFEGYGDNPALANGRSKTDKNIAGLMQSTTDNEVTYYTFTNLEEINIEPDTETTIASLAFTSAQTTTVKIMHEFIFDMIRELGIDGGYELRYYLDEELLTYKPYESLSAITAKTEVPIVPQPSEEPYTEEKESVIDPIEFSITRDFFYVIRNVAPNQRHTWQVKIITHGIDETTIDTRNAHVVLEGQRLYGEEHFDGHIEVRENISKISLVGIGVKELTELVDVDARTALIENISENITLYDIGAVGVTSLGESVQVVKTWLPLATETHILIKTEDGKLIRVEM